MKCSLCSAGILCGRGLRGWIVNASIYLYDWRFRQIKKTAVIPRRQTYKISLPKKLNMCGYNSRCEAIFKGIKNARYVVEPILRLFRMMKSSYIWHYKISNLF